jgi:hypothetical protein
MLAMDSGSRGWSATGYVIPLRYGWPTPVSICTSCSGSPAIRIRRSRLATCILMCKPCWRLERHFRPVVRSWSEAAAAQRHRGREECLLNAHPTRSDGVDRLVGLARFELATLEPPDIGSVATNVPRRPISLEIRILDLDAFRWTKANGGQNVGQTHS